MAATTHGLQTLTYGVPLLTGYVVQTYSTSSTAANVIEVFDEVGNRKAARYDDVTSELTLECILAGATLPAPGAVFTYNAIKYECLSVDVKAENKGAKKVTIKGKTSEGITLS